MTDTDDRPDPFAEQATVLTRLLGAADPGGQDAAIMEALGFAGQAALMAWDGTEGQPPARRLRAALRAAAAELESLALAVPAGDQGDGNHGKKE
jgi:hypothetical protein